MNLKNVFSHRNRALLRELVITDFKLRYQGSALGYLWSLFRPLFLFVILLVVFGYFLKIGSDLPHYPIYLLLGIVLFNFFAEATNNGLHAIVDRGDLIRKINFPKYIIVISGTVSALINLGISMIVVFVFMLVSGVEVREVALLLPILIIELYVFALAAAFFLSALYVKFRDVSYVWDLVLQGGFYATPVLYPLAFIAAQSEIIAKAMLLNPLAQIIQDARYILVTPRTDTLIKLSDNLIYILFPAFIVLATIILASWYFKTNSKNFAEDV